MVIAVNLVWSHHPGVPKRIKNMTPAHLMSEMRPEKMGHRLRLLREAFEMRPAEISDYLEIERVYWSRFEGGKRPITESFAALLVDRFGVTLDFLILGRWDTLPFEVAQKMRQAEQRIVEQEPSK